MKSDFKDVYALKELGTSHTCGMWLAYFDVTLKEESYGGEKFATTFRSRA